MTGSRIAVWLAFAVAVLQGDDLRTDDYRALLAAHVDAEGQVDYAALAAAPTRLDAFLESIEQLDPKVYETWDDDEQLAFWINAYNAITLQAIVVHRPEKSIREIDGVWKKLEWQVMGRTLTLDQIENTVIRKEFAEPRFHMAIVCASIGCPDLRGEPFVGDRLGEQMDEQAGRFFADETKFRVDAAANRVFVSPLLDWYGQDFVDADLPETGFGRHSEKWRAALSFAARYVTPADRAFLTEGKYEIELLEYDWNLNSRPADR